MTNFDKMISNIIGNKKVNFGNNLNKKVTMKVPKEELEDDEEDD